MGESQEKEEKLSELGHITWHCSEAEGPPDIGMTLGLGDGKSLYVGEISSALWDSVALWALGKMPDSGWWAVLWPEERVVARFVDKEDARKMIEAVQSAIHLAAGLKQPAPTPLPKLIEFELPDNETSRKIFDHFSKVGGTFCDHAAHGLIHIYRAWPKPPFPASCSGFKFFAVPATEPLKYYEDLNVTIFNMPT